MKVEAIGVYVDAPHQLNIITTYFNSGKYAGHEYFFRQTDKFTQQRLSRLTSKRWSVVRAKIHKD
jgi:hypothetical protein